MLLWSKNLHILKGVTHDSGQKFQISFKSSFLEKRPWVFPLIMLFCQKEAFKTIKMTFSIV